MIKNKEKQFDCIKMKKNIQTQVYSETKDLSKAELLIYFNNSLDTAPWYQSPKTMTNNTSGSISN